MEPRPRVVLTIAGSDPSGGAGIQADLRAIAVHGHVGAAVITALTVQNSTGVSHVAPVDPALVSAQLAAVFDDMEIAAIKIGMLGNQAIVQAVAEALLAVQAPVVLDPVLRSTSGAELLTSGALRVLREELVPRCALVTPNLGEGRALLDGDDPSAEELARRVEVPVLLTGGHGLGDDVTDVLAFPGGLVIEYRAPRIRTPHDHGTGCLISTSIACALAGGHSIQDAVAHGRACVREGLRSARGLGKGPGAVLLLRLPRGSED